MKRALTIAMMVLIVLATVFLTGCTTEPVPGITETGRETEIRLRIEELEERTINIRIAELERQAYRYGVTIYDEDYNIIEHILEELDREKEINIFYAVDNDSESTTRILEINLVTGVITIN